MAASCRIPRQVKGFVFDLDGTLADTVGLVSRAWEHAFRSLGYNVKAEDVEPLIGLPAARIVEALTGSKQSLMELSSLRLEYLEEHAGEAKAFPETRKVLEELKKRGFRLAVATSLPSRPAESITESLGIRGFLDGLVGGDMVEKGKPEPDIFLAAVKAVKLDPGSVVIVGDRDYDVLPAKRIGSFSVLVVREGFFCPSEKPDAIVTSLEGLLGMLEERK